MTDDRGPETGEMVFKFEKLEIWKLSLNLINQVYKISDLLPREEEYNLKSQLRRAATSISLNIAEGSTGQTDAEQNRFLGLALRSLVECVACTRLIQERNYIRDENRLKGLDASYLELLAKIQAMRRSLSDKGFSVREESAPYGELTDENLY
jgi:four helix bundle protein